ncbi:MAG TPA: DUF885 family protein [bacterium]|nr:DUF885 family protein [bacterium]
MDRRTLLRLASIAPFAPSLRVDAIRDFAALRESYLRHALHWNPVVATYLGAGGLDPALDELDGRLRDASPEAIADELLQLARVERGLAATPLFSLPGRDRVDHAVIRAQVEFRRRMLGTRRYHQRAVDSYVSEPFRGVSLQLRAMDGDPGLQGTREEWERVLARVASVPRFLEVAQANLEAGLADGNIPDRRMVGVDGVPGARTNAEWFGSTLPARAAEATRARPWSDVFTGQLAERAREAATAWRRFAHFLEARFEDDGVDRFAIGAAEYDLRLSRALALDVSSSQLLAASDRRVAAALDGLVEVAVRVAADARLGLSFAPATRSASLRALFTHLQAKAPRDDEALFAAYRQRISRVLEWGRAHGFVDPDFGVPEPRPTPALFRATVQASYFPAPPFRRGGRARFYVTPSDGDRGILEQNCDASILVTVVHEIVPGHHWQYHQLESGGVRGGEIRWLTPGDVESSFSMWEDSMAAEGWATLAEELAARPEPGAPFGVYSPEEMLFQMQSRLLGEVGVRLDAALHTGLLDTNGALAEAITFLGFDDGAAAVAHRDNDPDARELCDRWQSQIYRYTKWPTQVLSYTLGRNAIVALVDAARARTPAHFDERVFFDWLVRQGTIPPGRLPRNPTPV